ncbi:MAG TPA: ATP-binding protein [Allosphingosinicella sp.]|nr:ATP-binding protein [Allosphingosinicella sp.]
MRRFLPRSLVGQIALVMGLALLVAQAVNFYLILNDRQMLSLAQNEGPAITRFVNVALEVAAAAPAEREALLRARDGRGRFFLASNSLIGAASTPRDARVESRLRQAAADNGLRIRNGRAAISERVPDFLRKRPERVSRQIQLLLMSVQLEDGSWLNARLITPRRDPWLAARLAFATFLLYAIVLGAMILIARRLARPLRDLTAAARRFEGRSEAPTVEPRGPADLRHAIEAFNDMNHRLAALLDEKDRMLGAIGHDLRTPLASLRIRAENVEADEERQRMIATIEEMTTMLDDTLVLARTGRAREPARAIDVTALADAVAEEFRGLGHSVTMDNGSRQVACIRPNLLRRAVRNLIDNAVKYGGSAEVAVRDGGGERVVIEVADRGPGIPDLELANVSEPFYRLEASRNRETGGSGLGLTIVRAVAVNHGGELKLENRPGGGLSARLLIPRS